MKSNKIWTAFLLAFVVILMVMPTVKVQASTTDIKIISETKVTAKQAQEWAKSKGASNTFVDLANLYWKYASEHGNVNPGIAYVQSAKETGYGKFGGVLDESYKNPCGLKTSSGGGDTDPNAHQRFNSWDESVQAHLDHLALYAGANGYPRSTTYDSRHFATIKGKAPTVNMLGGNWAPSSTYGEEINQSYNDLLIFAGVKVNSDNVTSNSNNSNENNIINQGTSSNLTPNIKSELNISEKPKGIEATEPTQKIVNNNTNISSSIGWKYENGRWYYCKSNGIRATGWIKPDSNWYYLYSDGVMAKGWIKDGGNWYYFNSNGSMQIGWVKDGGKWYYLQGDGSMINGLKLINGKKYFFDVSGVMRVGWFQISGEWYYFNSDGSMTSGWIKSGSNWYYLYSNGIMSKGWIELGSNMYYLKSNGAMATGWQQYGNDYYYLNPSSGVMMKDTVINGWNIGPDGKRGEKVNNGTTGSGKLIVIDAGHNYGGNDGAYATSNGVTYSERDLNMQVALKLKAKLEEKGYNVIMTREESDKETLGVTQSLTDRVNIANNSKTDFFVSVHHNAADALSASGVESYYSTNLQDANFGGGYSEDRVSKSREMAVAITNSLANATGAMNRGGKNANLFVCRNTTMPAVLIEFGFITNPTEAQKCANANYQDTAISAVADAIAAGI